MASALANLKTTYETTKSKILHKGKNDAEDADYYKEKEKVLFYEQVLVRLNKRSKKSLELFSEMTKVQNEIVTDIHSMYSQEDRLYSAISQMKEAAIKADADRLKMAERVEKNSIRPVDDYCLHFRDIKRRMDDYSNRRSEMEKQKQEVAKIQEKGVAAGHKLPMAEEKYRIALQRYEESREELMHDLPAFNEDRDTIFGYVLACSLRSQAEFYGGLAEKYNAIVPLVSSIDERAVLGDTRVITTAEASAAATNLRAHPVFNKDKDKEKSEPGKPQPQSPQQPSLAKAPSPQQPAQAPVQATYSVHKQTPPVTTTPVTTPTTVPNPTATPAYNPYNTTVPLSAAPSAPVAPTPAEDSPAVSPFKVQGLYDFTASEDNELSFKKGDIITIIAKHADWWEGEFNGAAGLLPSNYVREL